MYSSRSKARWVSAVSLAFFSYFLSPDVGAESVTLGEHVFEIPEGFEIELAARPPLVERPITIDFDEEGNLYVADSSGSNAPVAEQLEKKPHRILRLSDDDDDGVYDRSEVFADGLMFPEGTMWLDGSLYVSAPPSIWKLTDRDGDGRADDRVEWFQGKTLTGCANDLHGPYRGLDGYIYWCKGAFAEQRYERPDQEPFVTKAAHIFRARPGLDRVEAVMTGGMDNPIDVVFLDSGERIFTTTFLQHPGGGRRDGLIHAIYGGVYGKDHDVLRGHPRTGELMPPLVHLGPAAPCGLEHYRSGAFGPEYRGNLFATLFNLQKVSRHELSASGATYASKDSDFVVSSNRDFHPTDIIEDTDGSLLIVDTGGWYKICCPSSQLWKPDVLGAIYRVRKKGQPSLDDRRGIDIAWDILGAGDLARLLGDRRVAVRDRAQAALAERGVSAVPALRAVLSKSPSVSSRTAAVWTLCRIDAAEARSAVREAFADADETVRHAAAHAAAVWRDAGALEALVQMLSRDTPAVRRASAEALGRIGDARAASALLRASADPVDRVLEHSVTYALIEIGAADPTRDGLVAADASIARTAAIALDQMRGGVLDAPTVASFLTSADPLRRETASWIAERHLEWGKDLAEILAGKLSDPSTDLPPAELAAIERQLASFAREDRAAALIADLLTPHGADFDRRAVALRIIAAARLDASPASWTNGVARILASPADPSLRSLAVTAARSLRPGAGESGALREALIGVARRGDLDIDLRVEALAALPTGLAADDSALLDLVVAELGIDRPVVRRGRAADVIVGARLSDDQLSRVAEKARSVGPLELARLARLFQASHDEARAFLWIDVLEGAIGRGGLDREAFGKWLAECSSAVRERGGQFLASLDVGAGERLAQLEKLLSELPKGEIRRGQEIFNGTKAACSTCHAIGYLGGRLGPDLTRIGQIRQRRDLLESIVFPSSSVVRSYETTVVVTKRGEVHSGIARESADAIELVSGPEKEVRIPWSDVAELSSGDTSIMPAGLIDQLTREELADLLAFLEATRW
jgi:putative membrane-bound dehydrogenase-like protein